MPRLLALFAAVLLSIACGSRDARPANPAEARPAGAAAGAATSRFANVLYVPDPMPHLRRLYHTPAVQQAFASGPLAELVRSGGDEPDLGAGWQEILDHEAWIPAEAGFAFDDTMYEALDGAFRGVYLVYLIVGTQLAGPPAVDRDMPRLRQQMADVVSGFQVPRMLAWVRFRHEDEARAAFAQLRTPLGELPPAFVTAEEARVAISFRVGDLIPARELRGLLGQVGLSQPGDPLGERLVQTLGALEVRAEIEQRGAELRLALGGVAAAEIDRVPRPEARPSLLLWSRWDTSRLRELAQGWEALFAATTDMAGIEAMRSLDGEDSVGAMRRATKQLLAYAPRGEMSADLDDALRIVSIAESPLAPAPLAGSGLLPLVPADVPVLALGGDSALSAWTSSLLDEIDDTLTGADDVALYAPVDPAAIQRRGAAADALRTLVHERAARIFVQPTALLLDTRGTISELRVRGADTDERVTDLPVPQLALIGKVRNRGAANRLFADVYAAIVDLVFAHADAAAPPQVRVEQADLGLGVPAHRFTGGWIEALGGEEVLVTGGVELHYFFLGDFVVLSTDPALSRRIAASARAKQARRLPDPALIDYGLLPGSALGAIIGQVAAWTAKLEVADDESDRAFAVLRQVIGLVDSAEWRAVIDGGLRRTEFVLR